MQTIELNETMKLVLRLESVLALVVLIDGFILVCLQRHYYKTSGFHETFVCSLSGLLKLDSSYDCVIDSVTLVSVIMWKSLRGLWSACYGVND